MSKQSNVRIWTEDVVIPTYLVGEPNRNPMFLEKRVYQGSSGSVYPLPFTDRISSERRERAWEALHLENEFLRVMVLPEMSTAERAALEASAGILRAARNSVVSG